MSTDSIELSSRALVKLGARPIGSFADETTEARVAASLYPLVRDALLCAHPWSFATTKVALTAEASEPVADFEHAFLLPDGFLKALSVGHGARGRGLVFQIVNREIHTNTDEIVLSYVFRADEADFPPYFAAALVTRLAAEFCIPITENTARAERFSRLADEELRLAKLVDSQQDTPRRVEDFTLIEARS